MLTPMRYISRIAAVLLLLHLVTNEAFSQGVVLHSGESWSVQFSDLTFRTTERNSFSYSVVVTYFATSFTPLQEGQLIPTESPLQIALFEGQLFDGLLANRERYGPVGGILTFFSPMWADLDGSITLTAGFGVTTYTVQSLSVSVYLPHPENPTVCDVYGGLFTAVPEPSSAAILLTGTLSSLVAIKRRRYF